MQAEKQVARIPFARGEPSVRRAEQSIETVCLMYCYKVLHPNRFHMLRGNHECASINRIYGFFDECKRNYNVKLWRAFCDVFEWMPVAGIVSERIFCSHGGISPHLENMDQIRRIQRPTPVPDEGLLCDLLWSDPEPDLRGWADSDGPSPLGGQPRPPRQAWGCAGGAAAANLRAQDPLRDGTHALTANATSCVRFAA